MAKENKNAAQTAEQKAEVNESNVMETIRTGNLMPENLAKEVQEEISKEETEEKKSELKSCILDARYENFRALIIVRKARHEEKHLKTYLTKTKELLDELCTGKKTVAEYQKALREARDEKEKGFNECSKEFEENMKELRNSNGRFRYRW